ncbi:hypothetical protein SDRG_16478 [Saprolegnia diclina VS20]|uniref:Uncharacterized protein n=1 Tax=Saprolegnia diclina (strain VS20) TaxID=1156394 RepID=T0R836_SAPDV|nr:hypothetical protein SDRG_16478 [Saprolegnia diclina VS20]EQC25657.1 hypothetical protein SDRG_16478 [Saprolegnia diclina VS20]|eukprot:XP_008620914.1 hypothetical protein SDRG_16478 [Saprolegnia diclina VS20]
MSHNQLLLNMSTRAPTKRVKRRRSQVVLALRAHIHALESTRVRLGRARIAPLPWADVAGALQDDMLQGVAENRRLKKELRHVEALTTYLQSLVLTLRPPKSLDFRETWRHSHLGAGDATARETAYAWILNQLRFNTDRAMQQRPFPSRSGGDLEYLDVDVRVSDDGVFTTHVAHEFFVRASLLDTTDSIWYAEETFNDVYRQLRQRQPSRLALPVRARDWVRYQQEEAGSNDQELKMNYLFGRFDNVGDGHSIVVARSILQDDAFPVAATAWSVESSQWVLLVATPMGTRCRTYYTMHHPCTAEGYVSLEALAACCNVPPAETDAARITGLRHFFHELHTHQRAFFRDHVHRVLATLRRSSSFANS